MFLLSIRSGAHKLPPIFRLFAIFNRNLQKLWRHLATKMRTI